MIFMQSIQVFFALSICKTVGDHTGKWRNWHGVLAGAVAVFLIMASAAFPFQIIGGAALNDPPNTLPIPGTVTLKATGLSLWTGEGPSSSLYNAGTGLDKSTDGGASWLTVATTPVGNRGVLTTINGTILMLSGSNSTTIRRSVNSGSTFTTVYTNSTSTTGVGYYGFAISGNRYWALSVGALGATNDSKLVYSDDDGVIWVVANSTLHACTTGNGIAASGTTVVLATGNSSGCNGGGLKTSIDSGATFSTVLTCTGVNGGGCQSPILINGVFYVAVLSNTVQGYIAQSPDGLVWTNFISMPYSNTNGSLDKSLGSFFDGQAYYLYLIGSDPSNANHVTVWRAPIASPAWTTLLDTAVVSTSVNGNILTASTNILYFSDATGNFYSIEP